MTDTPHMLEPVWVSSNVVALMAALPVPGQGVLPVNAFVITGPEPLLVDTGLSMLREPFMAALRTIIDPAELRWIWLSHMDADHIGNLDAVLDAAPEAQVLSTFLGIGKMGLMGLPADRAQMIAPTVPVHAGGLTLQPWRPPYFDAPETLGFFNPETGVLFSGDAFGALLDGVPDDARAIAPETLRDGLIRWTGIDAPWLDLADEARLGAKLAETQGFGASVVLSGHLPPAKNMEDVLTGLVIEAHTASSALAA